jgi:hypothetical protein
MHDRIVSVDAHDSALVGEFRQAVDGFRPQDRGVAGNFGLSCPLDAWHSLIQCRDQLLQLTRELGPDHRHEWTPVGLVSRRETFQISPQLPQRQ